jgi:hypothetical protein
LFYCFWGCSCAGRMGIWGNWWQTSILPCFRGSFVLYVSAPCRGCLWAGKFILILSVKGFHPPPCREVTVANEWDCFAQLKVLRCCRLHGRISCQRLVHELLPDISQTSLSCVVSSGCHVQLACSRSWTRECCATPHGSYAANRGLKRLLRRAI